MKRHLAAIILSLAAASCGRSDGPAQGDGADGLVIGGVGIGDVRLPEDASSTADLGDAGTPTDATDQGCQWDADCPGEGFPCMQPLCHPDLGCLLAARPDGIACEDGNPCTNGGYCVKGDCKHAVPRNCDDANPCTFDWCRENDGLCMHTPTVNGSPCLHGDGCVASATCKQGKCTPTGQSWCDCKQDADCAKFDDGDVCNGVQYCDKAHFPWLCKAKADSAITCNSDSDTDCSKAACNSKTGVCYAKLSLEGALCDDGKACTSGDTCAAGVCTPTVDSCDK